MNKLTVSNTNIEIIINDITKIECDVIVIPTNSRLLPSGTLRCKVLREAGSKIQVECNRIIQKISNVPMGKAIMTSGGALNCKFIIHTRSGHDKKKIILATWNALKIADQKNELNSICFPPISIEAIGFNAQTCAKIMLPTIKKYLLEQNLNLKTILICVDTIPDYKEFEKALEKL